MNISYHIIDPDQYEVEATILLEHKLYIPRAMAEDLFKGDLDWLQTYVEKLAVARVENSIPVGWSLIHKKVPRKFLWVYVNPEYRRQQIGTKLIALIRDPDHGYVIDKTPLNTQFWNTLPNVF